MLKILILLGKNDDFSDNNITCCNHQGLVLFKIIVLQGKNEGFTKCKLRCHVENHCFHRQFKEFKHVGSHMLVIFHA